MSKKLQTESFYESGDFTYDFYKESQIQRHRAKWFYQKKETFYKSLAEILLNKITLSDLPSPARYISHAEVGQTKMICMGTRNNFERNCFQKYLTQAKIKVFSLDIAPPPPPRPPGSLITEGWAVPGTLADGSPALLEAFRAQEVNRAGVIRTATEQVLSGNIAAETELAPLYNVKEHPRGSAVKYFTLDRDDRIGDPPSTAISALTIDPWAAPDYVMDFQNLPSSWTSSWHLLYSNSLDHAISATDTFSCWLNIVKNYGFLILGFDFKSELKTSKSDPCIFHKKNVEDFFKNLKNVRLIETLEHRYPYTGHVTYFLQKVVDSRDERKEFA